MTEDGIAKTVLVFLAACLVCLALALGGCSGLGGLGLGSFYDSGCVERYVGYRVDADGNRTDVYECE